MLILSIIFLTCALGSALITIRDVRLRREFVAGVLLAISCLCLGLVFLLNYMGSISDSAIMNMGDSFEIINW